MSSPMSEGLPNMPLQLANLLRQLPSDYTRMFSRLFTMLPQELSIQFCNRLASTLTPLRNYLPLELTSPPPDNPALPPDFLARLTQLIDTLTIMLGTMFTIVTFIGHHRGWCSTVLPMLQNTIYAIAPSTLPALVNVLRCFRRIDGVFQPDYTLTSFPSEIVSLFSNTVPSDLYPSSTDLNNHLCDLVGSMFTDFRSMLTELNEVRRVPNNSTAATDYHFEGITVPYVYQARGVTDTDPYKCSVCLEDMKDGECARRLCCMHSFHLECIDRCLKTKRSCPLCRTPINATHS